jgi:hypothetical protein
VVSGSPPSWPPWNHTTLTGAPVTARALPSAWSRGNRESDWPWTRRVGTWIRPATDDGLDRRSVAIASGVGRPVSATVRYIAHSDGRNRPQPVDDAPPVKKIPAQTFLNTPFAAPLPVASGNRESARSYQVICGAMASMRRSYAAASREIPPPYDAPAMPTRGSPGPSSRTSGRRASQSMSCRTSFTS